MVFSSEKPQKNAKNGEKNTLLSKCCPPAHKGPWAVFLAGLHPLQQKPESPNRTLRGDEEGGV